MLYKLALYVLVTFTEQVVPIHKHTQGRIKGGGATGAIAPGPLL